MPDAPNPGSKEAIGAGCVCPIIDNRCGRGFSTASNGSPYFVMVANCPIHGEENHA